MAMNQLRNDSTAPPGVRSFRSVWLLGLVALVAFVASLASSCRKNPTEGFITDVEWQIVNGAVPPAAVQAPADEVEMFLRLRMHEQPDVSVDGQPVLPVERWEFSAGCWKDRASSRNSSTGWCVGLFRYRDPPAPEESRLVIGGVKPDQAKLWLQQPLALGGAIQPTDKEPPWPIEPGWAVFYGKGEMPTRPGMYFLNVCGVVTEGKIHQNPPGPPVIINIYNGPIEIRAKPTGVAAQ